MLKQIENKTYDVDFAIVYNDDSIEVVIKSMFDKNIEDVDLNTIDKSDLRCIMIDYYQDWLKELEEEDQELWGIDRDLGDVRIVNNTAILKHW